MAESQVQQKSRLGTKATFLAVVVGAALSTAPAPAAVNDISRYCTVCWRNARLPADVWPDCTQEVFVRLLERLPAEAWSDALNQDAEEHRELVRAIDCVKKRVQRARKTQVLTADAAADARGDLAAQRRDDWDSIRNAAAEVLTERQRRIIVLWAAGHDVADIAEEIGLSTARVSDEKYKAVKKLRAHLRQVMAS
jgi:RNA polymerase sigma factor (sigma-70 family)